jgi:2C-methyl-D-erythritol 2,4-cyclodiphosphate synthase
VKKKLDTSSKLGRIVFQMKDVSVRMKPEVRAMVIRVFNTLDADQEDAGLRFRLRDDLRKLGREPQLSSLVRMLTKELPST